MAKGYYHVTQNIRSQIYAFIASGWSLRKTAIHLGYNVSSISREIKRNRGGRGYRPLQANRRATERRRAASTRSKRLTVLVVAHIKEKIKLKWSPKQIAGFFKIKGEPISKQSIYKIVWDDKKKGGLLYLNLRHRGKRYNKKSSKNAGRGCIPGRIDILERPKIIESKSRIGDWEGDTIIGANHQGTIVSLVDRGSKFTLLQKVERKQASPVQEAIVERMRMLPYEVHSITLDNGKEFAKHIEIAAALNSTCYFATPYHAWERGLNEHTNGLVRQYFPKSTDLSKLSNEDIQQVQDALNSRPREVLGFRTPFEIFYQKGYSCMPALLK
jgi:IS30 family transposase